MGAVVIAAAARWDQGGGKGGQEGARGGREPDADEGPLTWEMIRVMEKSIGEWDVGGRIAWIGLALSY